MLSLTKESEPFFRIIAHGYVERHLRVRLGSAQLWRRDGEARSGGLNQTKVRGRAQIHDVVSASRRDVNKRG
jgi:hypothetical protein